MTLYPNNIGGRDVVTVHVYPPIPIRSFDWQAAFADDESNDDGQMTVGHGATEQEAIEDLQSLFDDGFFDKQERSAAA